MKEFFAWFGEKIIELWSVILNTLGLTTIKKTKAEIAKIRKANTDKVTELMVKLQNQIDLTDSARATADEVTKAYAELNEKYDSLLKSSKDDIEVLTSQLTKKKEEVDRYKEQVRRYEEGPKQQEDYLKAVQKQLNELFKENRDFGFPNALPIPGSISFNLISIPSENADDYPDEVVKGRIVLPDNVETMVQEAPDLHTKYEIVINALRKYGTLNGIMTKLINSGCVQLTLTYDPDSESTWVYFEVTARGVKRDACFLLDIPEK